LIENIAKDSTMQEISIFLDEDDIYNGEPLYDHIIHYLQKNNINGSTALSAFGGFGLKHHFHLPKRIWSIDENPMMIVIVDEEEKVQKVLPHLKEVIKEGLLIIETVEIV
jgi:PII-like signaling protein